MDANRFPAQRALAALAGFILAAVLLAAAVSPALAGDSLPNPENRTLREGCERPHPAGEQASPDRAGTLATISFQDPGNGDEPTAINLRSLTAFHFNGHIPRAVLILALALVVQAVVLGAGRLRRGE